MYNASFYQATSKKLVDILPYDIIWINQKAEIVYANKSISKNLGYSLPEMEELSMYDINPTLNPEKWEKHWNIVKQNKLDHFKTYHKKKNGQNSIVEVFSLFFSNNGNSLICSIFNDISESSFYRTILEETEKAVSVGGWKWNLVDETILASSMAKNIFKVTEAEELLPSNILTKFLEPEKVKKAFSNLLRKGINYDLILKANINSNLRWIRCISTGLHVNGKLEKIYGT
ncbi:MAG: PAS domain-containing protein, partial [Bacteroidota bacterium]